MKVRIKQIAEDFGISVLDAKDIIYKYLDEDMVTGRGNNLWINEAGQLIFDDVVKIPVVYRGRVTRLCPNPLFIMVNIKEIGKNVPVRILRRNSQKNLLMKYIYVEAGEEGNNPVYKMIKPKLS